MNNYLKKNFEFLVKKYRSLSDVDTISFVSEKTGNTNSSLYDILKSIQKFKENEISKFELNFDKNDFYIKNLDDESLNYEKKSNPFDLKFGTINLKRFFNQTEKWLHFFIEGNIDKKNKNCIEIKKIKKIFLSKKEILNLICNKIKKLTDTLSQIDFELNENNFDLNERDLNANLIEIYSKNSKKNFSESEFEIKSTFKFLLVFWNKIKVEAKFQNSFFCHIIKDQNFYKNSFFNQIFNYIELNNKNNQNEFKSSINKEVLKILEDEEKKQKEINSFFKWGGWEEINIVKSENYSEQKKQNLNKIEQNKNDVRSKVISFEDFLIELDKDYKFSVSFYQRNYVWDVKYIEKLFNDILKCKNDEIHYINQIIFEEKGNNEFEIVDGQQRIISLLIIFLAIIKYAYFKKYFIPYDSTIENSFNHHSFLHKQKIKKNFKYRPDESFKNLLNNFSILDFKELSTKLRKDFNNLEKNFEKIVHLIFENINSSDEFSIFFNKLLRNLNFTKTIFSKNSNRNILNIFKNLNTTSVKLTSFDLITSYLFEINKNDPLIIEFKAYEFSLENNKESKLGKLKKQYENYRKNIEKIIKKSTNPESPISTFIKTIMKGNLSKKICDLYVKDDMYQSLRNLINYNKNISKKTGLFYDLENINNYFDKYIKLFLSDSKKLQENNLENELIKCENELINFAKDFLILFSYKDVYKPFIFKIFELSKEIINKKTGSDRQKQIVNLRKILFILEIFLVRNSICKPGTSHSKDFDDLLNYINDDLLNHINNSLNFSNKEDLIYLFNEISNYFYQKTELIQSDDLTLENLKNNNFSIKNDFVTKLILNRLEHVIKHNNFLIWKKDYLEYSFNIPFNNYEIEHFLPKKGEKFKKWIKEEDYEKNVNKIGNLSLFKKGLNSSLSNKSPSKKLIAIEKNDFTTTNIPKILDWNEWDYKNFKEQMLKKINKSSYLKEGFLEKIEEKLYLKNSFLEKIEKYFVHIKPLEEKDSNKEDLKAYKDLENLIQERSNAISNLILLIWNENPKEWINVLDPK